MASIVISVVSVTVGAAGFGFGAWRDVTARARERQRDEREAVADAARQRREALEACLDLNDLLGDWHSAIETAAGPGTTVHATREALWKFMRGHDFDNRLRRRLEYIPEPEGHELRRLARDFQATAFEVKGSLHMRLMAGEFEGDYEAHKSEAMRVLTSDYDAFQAELDRVWNALGNAPQAAH